MKKKNVLYVLFVIMATSVFAFNVPAEKIDKKLSTPAKIENFSLKDYNGKTHSLKDYKDSKAIVIMFISTQCPVSNGYNTRMEELQKKYGPKNVTFIGINANKAESAEEIKSHAKEHNLDFVILKDEKNVIADKLGASVTPEIYLVNPDFDVLYQGRIDDSRDGKNITSRDLENALNEVLAGKKVSVTKTKAFGCSIKRVDS